MLKVSRLILSAVLPIVFAVVLFAAPVNAQKADIQNGLCTGANLELTGNISSNACSTTDPNKKINDFVHKVINLFSAVVGIIAVIMIIVGGLRYITSGGNDASVTSAKNTLLYAIIGLVIVALAQIIVGFTLRKIANG